MARKRKFTSKYGDPFYFIDRSTIVDGCWIWGQATNGNGYGKMAIPSGNGQPQVSTGAHRGSYAYYKGPIPKGLHVLHSCDTKACVNPFHLRLGTASENMREMDYKGRRGTDKPKRTQCKDHAPGTVEYLKFHTREVDGCWEWVGAQVQCTPYTRNPASGKVVPAARWMWECANSKAVPTGTRVFRGCRNKRCINPEHLTMGGDIHNAHRVYDREEKIRDEFRRNQERSYG